MCPQANGVGRMTPNFGAGAYPYAGQWTAIWIPSFGINPSGGGVYLGWTDAQNQHNLTRTGAGATVLTMSGQSAVQCPSTSQLANADASLVNTFNGTNIPIILAHRFRYDGNNANAQLASIEKADGSMRGLQAQTDAAEKPSVLRFDGATVKTVSAAAALVVGNIYSMCFSFDGTNIYVIDKTGILAQLNGQLATNLTNDSYYVNTVPAGTGTNQTTVQCTGILKPQDTTKVVEMSVNICKWMETL